MCEINTEYFKKNIDVLQKSYDLLKMTETGSVEYEVYRNSLVKGFELSLEQSGKLLKRKLLLILHPKRLQICCRLRIFSGML